MLSKIAMIFIAIIVMVTIYESIHRVQERTRDNMTREKVQKYLANPRNKRPLMWIHVPYEANTRKWVNFMSRKTNDLNQPYIELCIQSIINHCDDTFNICIIDDSSFNDLLPDWTAKLDHMSGPPLEYIRQLGMTKLIYEYGGMLVPSSFLCMRDMITMYETGLHQNKMFICENVNTSATVSGNPIEFISNIQFIGAEKENEVVGQLVELISNVNSTDYTSEDIFKETFNNWCSKRVGEGSINLIYGSTVGTKTVEKKPVTMYDLLDYTGNIPLCPNMYGIWIPARKILLSNLYGWFPSLRKEEILNGNFALSKYFLLGLAPADNS